MLAAVGAAALCVAAIPASAAPGAVATTAEPACLPLFGGAACNALVLSDTSGQAFTAASPAALPAGYGPSDFHSAYGLPTTGPAGQTIAIVDAFDAPTIEADLAAYDAAFGLPACTTANGCFRKVDQTGASAPLPAPNDGWALEISLDVEVAHAICQSCKILLVEAQDNSFANLGAAVNRAAAMGATVISNSYGGGEFAGEQVAAFNHPFIAITASTGDSGFGPQYPAADPNVIAVGGTRLLLDGSGQRLSETAWSGAGSGCSGVTQAARFQKRMTRSTVTGCGARRAISDVAAVADPSTGAAVRFNGRWQVVGGTSLAAPLIAGVYGLAGNAGSTRYPAQIAYRHAGSLFDVTSGSNGSCGTVMCRGAAGYDGPTGLGTPNGLGAF
jgi:subtilase family serine protease